LVTDGHGTALAVILTDATATTLPSCCHCWTPSPPVRARRIVPIIARRGTLHGLRVRWERGADIHEARIPGGFDTATLRRI